MYLSPLFPISAPSSPILPLVLFVYSVFKGAAKDGAVVVDGGPNRIGSSSVGAAKRL